ncbi:MAG: type I glyceraldehyde-3-phosphate dehydrogenase [Planctomycetota bacterium]
MSLRVGINGFGRMGRNIFRALYTREDIEIVAINDIADPTAIEYLLRFDTLHGQLPDPVRIVDGALYARARRIPVTQFKSPGEIPWYQHGADVVVEATGRYRSRDEIRKHLEAGADRVILTNAPRDGLGDIDGVYIRGVTRGPLAPEHRLLSCGTSTGNCTAVMLKILDDAFPVERAFFTSVHAYTNEQSLIDVPNSLDLRLSRAAMENIVPVKTWTPKLIEHLFPHLQGRFGGANLNVPVPDVSCVDLVTFHRGKVELNQVNEIFRSAAASTYRDVLAFTDQPVVSSDAQGSTASCVFDSLATMKGGDNMMKTLGWYDQGGGLAHRVVDLIGAINESQRQKPRTS